MKDVIGIVAILAIAYLVAGPAQGIFAWLVNLYDRALWYRDPAAMITLLLLFLVAFFLLRGNGDNEE